jgi:hypothetical protein
MGTIAGDTSRDGHQSLLQQKARGIIMSPGKWVRANAYEQAAQVLAAALDQGLAVHPSVAQRMRWIVDMLARRAATIRARPSRRARQHNTSLPS